MLPRGFGAMRKPAQPRSGGIRAGVFEAMRRRERVERTTIPPPASRRRAHLRIGCSAGAGAPGFAGARYSL